MKESTKNFHETLIRLTKGMIKAWERWLGKQKIEKEIQAEVKNNNDG